jgi:hypothetical protein
MTLVIADVKIGWLAYGPGCSRELNEMSIKTGSERPPSRPKVITSGEDVLLMVNQPFGKICLMSGRK